MTDSISPTSVTETITGQVKEHSAELSTTREAEMARAQVELGFALAARRPRDWDVVRSELIKECKRPYFATSAIYALPRGGKTIKGLSIRFAEAAARYIGNLGITSTIIHDDDKKRVIQVMVNDLQGNIYSSNTLSVEKTIERSRVAPNQRIVKERVNSRGQRVYIVEADDADLTNKQAALEARVRRNLILQIIPGWLQDECWDVLGETAHQEAAKDPDANRRRLLDSFENQLGINPDALAQYLGHPTQQITPDEIIELRTLYTSLRDGDAKWHEVLEEKKNQRARKQQNQEPPMLTDGTETNNTVDEIAMKTSGVEAMKEKLKAKKA